MKNFDISNELFEIVEEISDSVLPAYMHQLEKLNMNLSYEYLDNILQRTLKMDVKQRCIWYGDLEDFADIMLTDGTIDQDEFESIISYHRFGIKLD